MYVLHKGVVREKRKILSGETFVQATHHAESNICFGEALLIAPDEWSASLYAVGEVECLLVSRSAFEKLCEAEPGIGYRIVREIGRNLLNRLRVKSAEKLQLTRAALESASEDISQGAT